MNSGNLTPAVRRVVGWIAPPRMGRPFRWNLASVWVGNLGDGIAIAAGPLFVASQTRDPTLIAAAAIVQRLPVLPFGLFAGALADRLDRKRLVVAANVVRAAVIAVLIATILSGTVSIWVALVTLFFVGVAEQFADAGSRAVLPMIVASEDLGVGNARQMAGYLVANEFLGPPIGAFLFAAGMALPFGVQAAALLLAAWLFTRIELPARASQPAPVRHVGREIAEGLRWIRDNAAVRTLTVVILLFNISWGAPWGILVHWAKEQLHTDEVGYGLLSTASGVGGALAIFLYDRLERRFSLGSMMKVCLALEVAVHALLALTTAWWLAMVIMFLFGLYAFVWASVAGAVRQRATPLELQGRVGSVYSLGLFGGLLVGQALGGVIARWWGPAAPFWFAFVTAGLTLAWVWPRLDSVAHAEYADPSDQGSAANTSSSVS